LLNPLLIWEPESRKPYPNRKLNLNHDHLNAVLSWEGPVFAYPYTGLFVLKVDLHIHTAEDRSDIIRYNAFRLIDRAAELNFDAIAITNHNFVLDDRKIENYAEKNNILLVPGMEATLSNKHVLLINPDFKVNPRNRSLFDLRRIKSSKSLIIATHPFFPQFRSLKSDLFPYLPYFDAIEFSHYYNAMVNCNKKAVILAKQNSIPLIGTSDCHFFYEFGTTYSLVNAEKDTASIIEAIKNGKLEIVSKPLSAFTMGRIAVTALFLRLYQKIFQRQKL